MNIDQTLKDVANYFKQKIIEGDFEFKDCDEFTVTILVDNKYKFCLWLANDPKYNFNFYGNRLGFSSDEPLLNFNTQKERLAAWKQVKPHVEKYRNQILKMQKEQELKKLKQELEKLNNAK